MEPVIQQMNLAPVLQDIQEVNVKLRTCVMESAAVTMELVMPRLETVTVMLDLVVPVVRFKIYVMV